MNFCIQQILNAKRSAPVYGFITQNAVFGIDFPDTLVRNGKSGKAALYKGSVRPLWEEKKSLPFRHLPRILEVQEKWRKK